MHIPTASRSPIDPIPGVEESKTETDIVSKPRVTSRTQAPTAQEVYHVPGVQQTTSRAIFNIQAPQFPILARRRMSFGNLAFFRNFSDASGNYFPSSRKLVQVKIGNPRNLESGIPGSPDFPDSGPR